jgi:hypothetical protein
MARKPSNQPATIYDYRRCKALCDVLAAPRGKRRTDGLRNIAKSWGIDYEASLHDVIQKLAQHALQHGREQ